MSFRRQVQDAIVLGLALVCLSAPNSASAQAWDGGGGNDNWSTAANWNPDGVPANNGTANLVIAGNARLTPNADAAWDFAGLTFNNTAGAFTLGGSQLTIRTGGITNNSTNTQTIGNNIVLNIGQTWNAASGNLTATGVISGGGSFTKSGSGLLTLTGVNTFTSILSVAVNGGPLNIQNGSALGSSGATNYTLINSGGAVQLQGNISVAEPFQLLGDGISSTGTLRNISGVNTITGTVYLWTSSTIGADAGALSLSGVISQDTNGLGLTKVGAGTVVLSAANTYSGATAVNAGRLTVNNVSGSGTGTGAVTVAANGTLSGSGTITGAVTLSGTVEPGVNTGTLRTGAETWATGGHYVWQINQSDGTRGSATGWDWLSGTGTLTISATSANPFTIHITSLDLTNAPGQAANFNNTQSYTWTIATGSSISSFAANKFVLDASAFQNSLGGGTFSIAQSGSNINLVFTPFSGTTLGNGIDPGNASLAPGGAATMADAFTFQTASGTDAITAVTVTLATGTSGGLSLVEITNDAGNTVFGSVSNPASDTPAITLTTNITATTTSTQYKIRVTPKSHAAMPAPPGSICSVTAFVSAWTGTNAHAGTDSGGTTVTIDNLSPGNVTGSTATPGSGQVALSWTNPGDSDLGTIIVLRRATSAVGDTPTEGATYAVGNTIGSSTVACVVTAPAASCTDTGLTNGTSYNYKIFTRDVNGNYSTGVVPTGSPATPNPTISGNVFEDVNYGGGAGRSRVASSGTSCGGTRVELYSSGGVYSAFTTTDASGNYSFTNLAAGTYYVRVVNSSITSSRAGCTGSAVAVQTYRTDATSGAAVPVTDYVGGTDPSVVDPGNGSTGATFSTTTFVYSAVLTGTAQSVTKAVVSSTDITGLDFGFNFDTIVNINGANQGSLQQFILNANLLSNTGLSQAGRTAGIDNAIWMISNGTGAAGSGLRSSNNYFSGGVATISPTSPLQAIADPVILDAQTQPGWSGVPIVQLSGSLAGAGARGLDLEAGGSTVRGFTINGFAGNSNSAGVWIGAGNGSTIQGNYIGTDAAGSASAANYQGIYVATSSNTIGGSTSTQRNVISGNTWRGILVDNGGGAAGSNVIRGNYVGTNAAGSAPLANSIGIYLSQSPNNIVGGTGAGEGNVTSGNTNYGIYLVYPGASGNLVQGNTVGLNAARSGTVPNGSSGVEICCIAPNGATGNTIGGTTAAAANVISGNGGRGVLVRGGAGNAIRGNSIYGNGGIGIDLGADNVTLNDGAKPAGQPNVQMDFPVFTAAVLSGTTLTVAGYVGNAPGQSLFGAARVEIFKSDSDPSGYGEGQTYLGVLTADGSGNFSGPLTVSGLVLGDRITATATDGSGNTSEFGANVPVTGSLFFFRKREIEYP